MYFQESPHNFFSRWLTTAEMFGHFPACLCCVTCQPRAEGLARASTYILTMLNCIVSARSLANLKRRVLLLHTSLNRQFDVHYCLEPLQFSHGYQRKEQLMAIFFSLTRRLRCFWVIKGSRIRSACVQEGRNHIQFHFEHIHLRLVIFFSLQSFVCSNKTADLGFIWPGALASFRSLMRGRKHAMMAM